MSVGPKHKGGQKPYGYYTPRDKTLTEKEVAALEGICADKTHYLISIEENVDPACITRRLKSAMRKLDAHTKAGLAIKYYRLKVKDET